MKQWLTSSFFLLALCQVGCNTRPGTVMTMDAYYHVQPGMTAQHLKDIYGPPIRITTMDNHVQIYEYIERFTMGPAGATTVEARRYYFYVTDGKISGKRVVIANQPSFEPQLNELP